MDAGIISVVMRNQKDNRASENGVLAVSDNAGTEMFICTLYAILVYGNVFSCSQ